MKHRNRHLAIAAAVLLLVAAPIVAFGQAGTFNNTQPGQFFNETGDRSDHLEICHIVKPPTGAAAVGMYGFHVENTSAGALFACLFDSATTPSNGVVPTGGCWDVAAHTARDVNLVQGSLGFNSGITVCLSTTDATFTAATAVGLMWTLYRGVGSTPTPTATLTPTPTAVPPTATASTATPTPSPTPTVSPTPTKTPTPTAVPTF